MQMEEYIGKEKYLEEIVQFIIKKTLSLKTYQERIFMQLYLGRIPYQVHNSVGYFDHTFSNCGGEDMDFQN
jgi:hypothetical protein